MSIELTIKYSDAEYKSAIKEKLAVMPNKYLHTFLPATLLALFGLVLFYFNVIYSLWGLSILVLVSVYAIPCLLGDFLMPHIALAFARKKKLQDTYHFTISEHQIERTSEKGTLTTKWENIVSVDFFTQNVFINLENGAMFIPNARLTDNQLEKLRSYAART